MNQRIRHISTLYTPNKTLWMCYQQDGKGTHHEERYISIYITKYYDCLGNYLLYRLYTFFLFIGTFYEVHFANILN